jgi:hypothetical protein
VNETRWVNPHQPQTLYMGTILCYVDAVFGLLGIGGPIAKSPAIWLVLIVGLAGGGFGVANEKKWGYAVAVAAAVLQLVALFGVFGTLAFREIGLLMTLMFDVVLVALLVHPMSRDYQRIWFK